LSPLTNAGPHAGRFHRFCALEHALLVLDQEVAPDARLAEVLAHRGPVGIELRDGFGMRVFLHARDEALKRPDGRHGSVMPKTEN
jgi:hypothetical protein